jgi:sec-independent protein translocase protein TatB
MFDIGWSELLVIGVVALIVVGPKELPVLLRTVGRYLGMIKRQAAEFRQQFDDAIRESEIATIKKDVEGIGQEFKGSLAEVEATVKGEFDDVRKELDDTAHAVGYRGGTDRAPSAEAGDAVSSSALDGPPTPTATDVAGGADGGGAGDRRADTFSEERLDPVRESKGAVPT